MAEAQRVAEEIETRRQQAIEEAKERYMREREALEAAGDSGDARDQAAAMLATHQREVASVVETHEREKLRQLDLLRARMAAKRWQRRAQGAESTHP